ncbi:MAG: hypothetical protein AAFU58_01285 [Pseudomonadota bacterium]
MLFSRNEVGQGVRSYVPVDTRRGARAAASHAAMLTARRQFLRRVATMAVMAVLATILAFGIGEKVRAETVLLDGIVTDGSFLSSRFVADPSQPGGGSIMSVDQLGLTDTPLTIALEFAPGVLGDPIMDGYSFLILDPNSGLATGSNLSISGTLGDPSMGGFVFETAISGASSRALIDNGVLSVVLPIISGPSSAGNSLAGSASGLLTLMSAPLPMSVQTVGDLVTFLRTTGLATSGTLPVEFFASNGPGEQTFVTTDIDFVVNADGEIPAVPLPAAAWIFVAGLAAMARSMRRKSLRPNMAS